MEQEYNYNDAMFIFKKAAKEVDKKNNTHLSELLNVMEDIHDKVAEIDDEE